MLFGADRSLLVRVAPHLRNEIEAAKAATRMTDHTILQIELGMGAERVVAEPPATAEAYFLAELLALNDAGNDPPGTAPRVGTDAAHPK